MHSLGDHMKVLTFLLSLTSFAFGSAGTSKPTIVLVHGAFADGSSWARVVPILDGDGYNVLAVQNPLTSLEDDIATTKRVIDAQKGPVVVVGHSYGGAVITAAAAGSADVKALVYVAALAPEADEVLVELHKNICTTIATFGTWRAVWDPAAALVITRQQRHDLEALIGNGKTPQRIALRALIVLAAAEGKAINAIAQEFGVARPTVYLWRSRFEDCGVIGLLKDAPRAGRRPALTPTQIATVVEATLQTTPLDATHWSVRTMAKARGSATRWSIASGRRTACNRIAWRPSN